MMKAYSIEVEDGESDRVDVGRSWAACLTRARPLET